MVCLNKIKAIIIGGSIMMLTSWGVKSQENLSSKKTYTLENGLHVVINKVPFETPIRISLAVKTGKKNETLAGLGELTFFSKEIALKEALKTNTPSISEGQYELKKFIDDDMSFYGLVLPYEKEESAIRAMSSIFKHSNSNPEEKKRFLEMKVREEILEEASIEEDVITHIKKTLFKGHPYENALNEIKSDDIEKASTSSFSKKYYAPNNATLIITTFKNTEIIKEKVETYFASVKRADIPISKNPKVSLPELKDKSIKFYGKNNQYIYLARVSLISNNAENQKVIDALDMGIKYLTDPNDSPLKEDLIVDNFLAFEVKPISILLDDYYVYGVLVGMLEPLSNSIIRNKINRAFTNMGTNLLPNSQVKSLVKKKFNATCNQTVKGFELDLNYSKNYLYRKTEDWKPANNCLKSIDNENLKLAFEQHNSSIVLEYLPTRNTD